MKKWIWPLIIILSGLMMLRIGLFAGAFGAVEHDSGWYLGQARTLAERGKYASLVNTNKDDEAVGVSIHKRLSVQDSEGLTYFPAGVTVGPGYIVPEAVIIRVFGASWWALRAFSMISMATMLIVGMVMVWRLGGLLGVVIFYTWWWLVPLMSIPMGYEAFSEQTALLYLFLSLVLVLNKKRKWRVSLISGMMMGLALETKSVMLMASGWVVVVAVYEMFEAKNWKKWLGDWTVFILGMALVMGGWEAYRYWVLTKNFGIEGWRATNTDLALTMQSGGAGLENLVNKKLDMLLLNKKLIVWSDVGVKKRLMAWGILALSPAIILWLRRKSTKLMLGLSGMMAGLWFWFLFLSSDGWTRHAWQALVIAMMLVAAALGIVVEKGLKKGVLGWLGVSLIVILMVASLRVDKLDPRLVFNEGDLYSWSSKREEKDIQGLPFVPLFSLKDQKEVVKFMDENVGEKDRVFYHFGFLVADLPALTDRVFWPLQRYAGWGYKNPEGGKSYLVFGPYQITEWKVKQLEKGYLERMTGRFCEKVVFDNPSYRVCELVSEPFRLYGRLDYLE